MQTSKWKNGTLIGFLIVRTTVTKHIVEMRKKHVERKIELINVWLIQRLSKTHLSLESS
jgi:hypothetical protein